jgi:hypothetical protein
MAVRTLAMPHTLIAQVSAVLALSVVLCALAKGRWPERVVAGGYAINWLADVVLQDRRLHHHTQAASFAVDAFTFALVIAVVLASRRTWVLWAAAFFLLTLLTHIAMLADVRFGQWTYLTALYIWGYGVLVSLTCGVVAEAHKPAPWPLAGSMVWPPTGAPSRHPS